MAQGYGTVALHPFGLSYYNLLVGGLPGAQRLGLELTYWNDAVDRVLLDRLAAEIQPGATAALAPTLYPGQGIMTTTGALVRRDVILQDDAAARRSDWVLVSRRRAYWKPELKTRIESGTGHCVVTRSRQGVWLSALWHFPREDLREKPRPRLDPPGQAATSPTKPPDSPAGSLP